MKRLLFLLAVCAFLRGGAWAADPTITFTTSDSTRMSATTGYIDWAQIRSSSSRLINIFGYNSGSTQFLQLFDSTNGPIVAISDTIQATKEYGTASAKFGGLFTGEPVYMPTNFAGTTAGIYFVRATNTTVNATYFSLYDTRAHALASPSTTGIQTVNSDALTSAFYLMPKHSFAVAATDNYSCIISGTGMGFGRGIVAATSTTAAVYTPGGTNITVCATLLP